LEKREILIIEDDKATQRLLEYTLVKNGYIVYSANSGQEGLQYLEKINPALIILDMVMPDMDGYTFIKNIKQMPISRNIPVIVSSGKSGMKEYFELEEDIYKPDAFLTKPYKAKELIDTINKVI
jgi:CheY-like chemotaxis protein